MSIEVWTWQKFSDPHFESTEGIISDNGIGVG